MQNKCLPSFFFACRYTVFFTSFVEEMVLPHCVVLEPLLKIIWSYAKGFLLSFLFCSIGLSVRARSFQSCPTLCDLTDCSLSGSSVCGILQQEYWNELHVLLQGAFLTQGWNPGLLCLLHWQVGSLPLVLYGKPSASGFMPVLCHFDYCC